jgi:hypothetical protein
MTRNSFRYIALAIGLGLTLAGCMQNAPDNPYQAQYLSTLRVCQPGTHAQSSPIGVSGYRCVYD